MRKIQGIVVPVNNTVRQLYKQHRCKHKELKMVKIFEILDTESTSKEIIATFPNAKKSKIINSVFKFIHTD